MMNSWKYACLFVSLMGFSQATTVFCQSAGDMVAEMIDQTAGGGRPREADIKRIFTVAVSNGESRALVDLMFSEVGNLGFHATYALGHANVQEAAPVLMLILKDDAFWPRVFAGDNNSYKAKYLLERQEIVAGKLSQVTGVQVSIVELFNPDVRQEFIKKMAGDKVVIDGEQMDGVSSRDHMEGRRIAKMERSPTEKLYGEKTKRTSGDHSALLVCLVFAIAVLGLIGILVVIRRFIKQISNKRNGRFR